MMNKVAHVLLISVVCLGSIGLLPAESLAIEAYFDTEISTRLEPEPYFGVLYVARMDEEVPQLFSDIVYEPVIYLEIIFDASKTMDEPDINGTPKIDIAKEIATLLVNHFPARDTRFALRVNGTRYDNNCLDSEIVVPFRRDNAQEMLDTIQNIRPKGLSPITYSLRQVLQDFVGTKGTKIVFIITDGQETCDREPTDTCTTTMDMFLEAEFDADINIVGINTINDDAQLLLSCLAARGEGEFLDSNRNEGPEFARLIRGSQQLGYSISKVLDPETLEEGKILELLNRQIGDSTILDGEKIVVEPERRVKDSRHELEPGVYKIEFATVPPMASYFTLDRRQELTIALVRSGRGLDLYDRAHLALGNRYYDSGEFEKALEEYQKVLDFDANNVDAHLNMGVIYDDILVDETKAAEHYKTYLELQGPRQEEVRTWLRTVRGEPTQEEKLQEQVRQREEEEARKEAERLAAEEAARQEKERQEALEAYEEILTRNSQIRELSEGEVISGDVVHVTVSAETLDSEVEDIAMDVGNRINRLLERTPREILVYREDDPEVLAAQAVYDSSRQEYIIAE